MSLARPLLHVEVSKQSSYSLSLIFCSSNVRRSLLNNKLWKYILIKQLQQKLLSLLKGLGSRKSAYEHES